MTCEHHWRVIMGVLEGKVISSGYYCVKCELTAPVCPSGPPPESLPRGGGTGTGAPPPRGQNKKKKNHPQGEGFLNPLPHQGYSGRLARWPRFTAFSTSTSEETMTPK